MICLKQRYEEKVLCVKDIQKLLNIGRRQAYELVNSGQFHVIRIGKTIRVSNDVFRDWLNGQTRKEVI